MTSGPQAVNILLHTNDAGLGAVARHARYLARVRQVVAGAAPASAAAHIHVAAIDARRLLLHTDSAGWATRLRYAEPAIRRALAQRLRLHTDTIVTRVRPELAQPERACVKREISSANREHMRRVAEHIDHPELAQTLLRLARQGDAEMPSQAAATGRALT